MGVKGHVAGGGYHDGSGSRGERRLCHGEGAQVR